MSTYSAIHDESAGATSRTQSFATFVRDMFLNCGWVQTSDTGQTAPSAYSGTSNTNTVLGYMIFRMADALQATFPVFVKVEIASGGTVSGPALWFTIGSGSDGAGNITGIKGTRFALKTTNAEWPSVTSYASGDGSRIAVAMHASMQHYSRIISFTIERTKDIYGDDTTEGVFIGGFAGSGWQSQVIPFDGSIIRDVQAYPVVPVPQNSVMGSLAYGNNVGFVPLLPFGFMGPYNPAMGMLFYNQPDWSALNIADVNVHGEVHKYLTLGAASVNYIGWTNVGMAIRYE